MTWPLIVSLAAAAALAVAGGLLTSVGPWYRALRMPAFKPPDWLFGPAWTIILGLAAWSAAIGWTQAPEQRTTIVVLFALNALFHLLWSPLFFTFKRPDWALIEVPFLWLSILAPMIVLWPISHLASLLLLPYLVWVSFAAVLNASIVRLNPTHRAAH